MATIKRFIPKLLLDVYDTPEICEFTSQEDLLEISFVKTFRFNSNNKPDTHFYRYSLDGNKLMVETKNNESFIVGTISGKHNLIFPKWVSNDKNTNNI